jgi:hypothetical protein
VRLVGLPSGREPDPSEVAPAQSCRANVDQCTFDGSLDLAEEAKICILSDLSTLGNGNTPVLFDDFHCPRYDSIYKLCQDAFENIEPLLSDDIGVEDLFPQVCSMDWAIEARLCELFDPALDVLGALCDGYTGFSTAQCAGPLGS